MPELIAAIGIFALTVGALELAARLIHAGASIWSAK